MILLSDTAAPDAAMAEVVPLEFLSLDDPQQQLLDEMRNELEITWSTRVTELEEQLRVNQESAKKALEAAREEAFADRQRIIADAEQSLADSRRQVGNSLAGFVAERKRYFAEVEGEVVHLALAIAERVLHREVSIDPMMLRTAVRIALTRVAGEGKMTLRVVKGSREMWRDALLADNAEVPLEIVEDAHLLDGAAVLESTVGRVELGVREQLKEIERGFFDLLDKRPR